MVGGRHARDQELLVLRIIDRLPEIVAGEALDRLLGVPEGYEQELDRLSDRPRRHEDAEIARRAAILLETGSMQIGEIFLLLLARHAAAPLSHDHAVIPCFLLPPPDPWTVSAAAHA